MKILWVKPGKLLPLDSGGKLRTYNILRHLSASHEVTYLSYYGGARDREYEQQIRQIVPGTVAVHTSIPEAIGFARYLQYVRSLPSPAPFSVSNFAVSQVRQMVADWISQGRFDVAVCDFLASSLNFPRDLLIPTVLFQHNVETLLWRRRSQLETKWLDRCISKIEYAKMARFEPAQVRRFHHVLAVSDEDCRAMTGMVDRVRMTVIPTGVDLAMYRYDPDARITASLVVFAGSMDWAPNIDGVEYFCQEVWPLVVAQVPEARFRIAGRNPHVRVQRLASLSVGVTGSVPSILDHFREAAVLVVPLRIGGGTRIKIYEGMAMGKATVSTHLGAEGLDVRHGQDILLADEPRQFAEYVVRLLRDEETRRKYEAAAAMTAQKHDWSMVTERLVEALNRTIRTASCRKAVPEQIAANV
ncbi:MAG: glycosyltransferase family 4 protein [Candidatus Sulfotelmatobacter sp.]